MSDSPSLCLLMLAGEGPAGLALNELRTLMARQPYIVAADGGANSLAELGLTPHLLVGDGDSLNERALAACRAAGVGFTPLPREKDFTDGEAALSAVLDAGCRNFAVFGALGGGLDHQLGNLLLPLAYRERWDSVTFYGEDCRASYCFGQATLYGAPGDTVSLLPLSPAVTGLSLAGFRYPLNKATTLLGQSLTLRNELSAREARVEFEQGIMLIIHYPADSA